MHSSYICSDLMCNWKAVERQCAIMAYITFETELASVCCLSTDSRFYNSMLLCCFLNIFIIDLFQMRLILRYITHRSWHFFCYLKMTTNTTYLPTCTKNSPPAVHNKNSKCLKTNVLLINHCVLKQYCHHLL